MQDFWNGVLPSMVSTSSTNYALYEYLRILQGFWKGCLPSIVMVSNPSVNYMLYEYLRARLEDWRRVVSVSGGTFRRTSPAGAHLICSWCRVMTASNPNPQKVSITFTSSGF